MNAQGPLRGVKVIEFVGLGPAPFAAMLLSDLGADVIRIDRPGAHGGGAAEVLARGRRSAALDLKNPDAVGACLTLVSRADIVLEGFRPGVMERLGLGPDVALKRNPALVYGRMTGWGQHGPLAHAAGHDINYISLTGALDAMGTPDSPAIPLNLVGDFGGGSLYLAFGVLAALTHARVTGEGQVVDAAIVDGAASLMGAIHQLQAMGVWNKGRGENLLDGGAAFYGTYRCADGKHVSIGPLEPEFYALLLEKLGLADDPVMANPYDSAQWTVQREKLQAAFASRSREEWCAVLEGSDACFAPVLTTDEAASHPHMAGRGVFVELDGVRQAAPAPRFSRTPGAIQGPASRPGADTASVLADWGFSAGDIASLESKDAFGGRS